MIIPIKCFTCGHTIADLYMEFLKRIADKKQNVDPPKFMEEPMVGKILDDLGLYKICCRKHMLGQVDIIDDI